MSGASAVSPRRKYRLNENVHHPSPSPVMSWNDYGIKELWSVFMTLDNSVGCVRLFQSLSSDCRCDTYQKRGRKWKVSPWISWCVYHFKWISGYLRCIYRAWRETTRIFPYVYLRVGLWHSSVCWLLTSEIWVQSQVSSCEISYWRKCSRISTVTLANHQSAIGHCPLECCNFGDAAPYHIPDF
jgi:hypothetical protein